jgi:hypothetical protein
MAVRKLLNSKSRNQEGVFNVGLFVTEQNLAFGDTLEPFGLSSRPDKTLQVYGTFGTGSINFYCSNDVADLVLDPTNAASGWCQLEDASGTVMNLTAKAVKVISQNAEFITAKVMGTDATTSLKILVNGV